MGNLKIRSSAVGNIMATPRSKSEKLSETAKKYLQELALQNVYGIRKEINSRYLDKGLIVEQQSIELVEKVLDLGFIVKNETQYENDFITGCPDVVEDKYVLDVKSSWSLHTFPIFDQECPNKNYFYQLQSYMWLTGKQSSILAYTLINTPEDIVLDEIRRVAWAKKELEPSENTENDVRAQHEFDHIPTDKRVKAYLIERDEQVIEQIKEKIEHAREYYNEIIEKI